MEEVARKFLIRERRETVLVHESQGEIIGVWEQ